LFVKGQPLVKQANHPCGTFGACKIFKYHHVVCDHHVTEYVVCFEDCVVLLGRAPDPLKTCPIPSNEPVTRVIAARFVRLFKARKKTNSLTDGFVSGTLQWSAPLSKLQSSSPGLHIRCGTTEKRSEREQSEGHLGAERDTEAFGPHPGASNPSPWLGLSAIVSSVFSNAGIALSGGGWCLHRILLRPHVSDNAHPSPITFATHGYGHGQLRRDILFNCFLMRLHDNTARRGGPGESCGAKRDWPSSQFCDWNNTA